VSAAGKQPPNPFWPESERCNYWTYGDSERVRRSFTAAAINCSCCAAPLPKPGAGSAGGSPPPTSTATGITDLINTYGSSGHTPATVSGKDGSFLWHVSHNGWDRWSVADLDGDGIRDLVVMNRTLSLAGSFFALSGKDGRVLWRDALLQGERKIDRVITLDSRDLDGDGKPEVIVAFVHPQPPPDVPSSNDHLCERAVLSGQDGKVKWRFELARIDNTFERPFQFAFADLWGDDGIIDVVTLTMTPDPKHQNRCVFEVRAYSGKDGSWLWRHRCACEVMLNQSRPQPRIAIGNLDGAGKAVVIVSDYPNLRDPGLPQFLVQALDGVDGKVKWTWQDGGKSTVFLQPYETFAPVLVELGQGRRGVCVNGRAHPGANSMQLVLLDAGAAS
jgi:hypothetical protein